MKHYHFDTGESCVLNECVFFDYTGTGDYTEHKMQKFPFGDGSPFGTVTRKLPAENDYVYNYNDCPAGQSGYKKYFKYHEQRIGCVGDSIDRRVSGLREVSSGPVQTELVINTCSNDEPEPIQCSNEILGNLDSVSQNEDGTLNIQGWSCAKGCESGNEGNTIHVKAREPGTVGPGQYFLRAYQTNTSSTHSNQQCGIDGQHAFNINIPANIWSEYSGKDLLINGEGKLIPLRHEKLNGVHRIPEYVEPGVGSKVVDGQCNFINFSKSRELAHESLPVGPAFNPYIGEIPQARWRRLVGSLRTQNCPDNSPGERIWWDTTLQYVECVESGLIHHSGEDRAASYLLENNCPINAMEFLMQSRENLPENPQWNSWSEGVWYSDGSLTPSTFAEVDAMTTTLKSLKGQNHPDEWTMIQNWEEAVQRLEERDALSFAIWTRVHPIMAIRYFARASVRGVYDLGESESMIQVLLDQQGISRKNGNLYFVTNYKTTDDVNNEHSPGDWWKLGTWQQESNNGLLAQSIRLSLIYHDGDDVLSKLDFEGFDRVLMIADSLLYGIPSAVIETLRISEGKDPGLDTVLTAFKVYASFASPTGDVFGLLAEELPQNFFSATTVTLFGESISISEILSYAVVNGVEAEIYGGDFKDGFKAGFILSLLTGTGVTESTGLIGGVGKFHSNPRVNRVIQSMIVGASISASNGDSAQDILENSAIFAISQAVGGFTEDELGSESLGMLAAVATDAILAGRDPNEAVIYALALLAQSHANRANEAEVTPEQAQELWQGLHDHMYANEELNPEQRAAIVATLATQAGLDAEVGIDLSQQYADMEADIFLDNEIFWDFFADDLYLVLENFRHKYCCCRYGR